MYEQISHILHPIWGIYPGLLSWVRTVVNDIPWRLEIGFGHLSMHSSEASSDGTSRINLQQGRRDKCYLKSKGQQFLFYSKTKATNRE